MTEEDRDQVACPCGHVFPVPRSLRGGIANCPQCRQAIRITGGTEPLFRILLALGIGAVLLVTVLAAALGGPWAALVTLVVGGVIVGLAVLLS